MGDMKDLRVRGRRRGGEREREGRESAAKRRWRGNRGNTLCELKRKTREDQRKYFR